MNERIELDNLYARLIHEIDRARDAVRMMINAYNSMQTDTILSVPATLASRVRARESESDDDEDVPVRQAIRVDDASSEESEPPTRRASREPVRDPVPAEEPVRNIQPPAAIRPERQMRFWDTDRWNDDDIWGGAPMMMQGTGVVVPPRENDRFSARHYVIPPEHINLYPANEIFNHNGINYYLGERRH